MEKLGGRVSGKDDDFVRPMNGSMSCVECRWREIAMYIRKQRTEEQILLDYLSVGLQILPETHHRQGEGRKLVTRPPRTGETIAARKINV